MDLFKIFSLFDRSNFDLFQKVFYKDLCILVKTIKARQGNRSNAKFNIEEELHKYFRNLSE